MTSLYVNETLPATSEEAIREFNEKYLAALSAAPPPTWSSRFTQPVGAPRITFPLSMLAAKFYETKDQGGRFKSMGEASFDVKVVEFDTGYEARALDIITNTFAYRRWGQAASAFVAAEEHHVAEELAALLETGTVGTTPWDDLAFFHAAHLANKFEPQLGTWGNYQAVAKDPASIANLSAEMTAMRGVLDENGRKLGVEPGEIWLPTAKFQSVSNLLRQNMINNGESNPLLGALTPVHVPQLTDDNDWYLVDPRIISLVEPLIAVSYRPSATLGLRAWDESSDFYKDTGKLKVSAHIWKGFALGFPHGIRLVRGA